MPQDVATILNKVRTFKDFNEGDDPYGEHDFGAFDLKGIVESDQPTESSETVAQVAKNGTTISQDAP